MKLRNIFLSKKGMGTIELTPVKGESELVKHARRELILAGEDMVTIDGYLKVVEAFSDVKYSPESPTLLVSTITALLQYKNLKPLTDDYREWLHVGEATPGTPNVWQNTRNPEAFSNDGGKTYYLLSEANRRRPKKMHESVPFDSLHEL